MVVVHGGGGGRGVLHGGSHCQVSILRNKKGRLVEFKKLSCSMSYTDYAGLDIAVILGIAWTFLRWIANGIGGPTSASDSMGPKSTFRCHFLYIGPSYKQ